MRNLNFLGIAAIILLAKGCNEPKELEKRNYESSYNSSSTATKSNEDSPYLNNQLSTGIIPYSNEYLTGDDSNIIVRTSSNLNCDLVAIVKRNGIIVRNAYIRAGGSYSFSVPNGTYQVFSMGEQDGILINRCLVELKEALL